MKELTVRQGEVLKFVKYFINTYKYPPTIREVAERFKMTLKGSYDHIKALEKKEYIKCNIRRSRAIEVLERGNNSDREEIREIAILGSVAAGVPLFAEENYEGVLKLPLNFVGNGRKLFAVRVKGNSMKDAGILDGDIAVIKSQETANNGEIVVAVIDDAFALKRLYIEKNRIKLKSENSAFLPIYTQKTRILGKLVCTIRKYH